MTVGTPLLLDTYHGVETTLDQALKDYPDCRSLRLSGGSTMMNVINHQTEKHRHIKVLIILENQVPIAWAWSFHRRLQSWYPRERASWYFVKPEYRRKGIGTELYKWAHQISQRHHRRHEVDPHDFASRTFFMSVGAI